MVIVYSTAWQYPGKTCSQEPRVGIRNMSLSLFLSMPHLRFKLPTDTIQHTMFVKFFIISHELHQEAALGRKVNLVVPIVEIRKQNSTRRSAACQVSVEWPRNRLQLPDTNYLCTFDIYYLQNTSPTQIYN